MENPNDFEVPYMAILREREAQKIREWLKRDSTIKVIIKSKTDIGIDNKGRHTTFAGIERVFDITALFL